MDTSLVVTYPCVVGHKIVELTHEQMLVAEWRESSLEQRIEILLERVKRLENEKRCKGCPHGPGIP